MAHHAVLRISIKASDDIGEKLFIGADGSVGAGKIDGVTQFGGASGEIIEAIAIGIAEVVAGENLAVGDKVTANAVGKAVKENGIYTVLRAASSNELAEILIK